MAYSEAQKRATMKYIKNNYDEIKVRIPKGRKQVIKDFAESKGKSLNSFTNEAIDEKMERDK